MLYSALFILNNELDLNLNLMKRFSHFSVYLFAVDVLVLCRLCPHVAHEL